MVADLVAEGRISSPEWESAFASVPRHVFVPYFFDLDSAGRWIPVTVETTDEASWLGQVYTDRTCVTQLDGGTTPLDVQGAVEGLATSSSTEPGLMADMLEALELDDGMAVVEIGTGTGYNAALLSERLGEANVTSIEVDPKVSAEASEQLRKAGLAPRLVVGDGAVLGGPRVDRLIATCSFPTIPDAWLSMVKPGGIIITTVFTKPFGMAIVKVSVGERRGEGEFIVPGASFMETRTPPSGPVRFPDLEQIEEATERATEWNPADLFRFPVGFLAGWVLGDASFYPEFEGGWPVIIDHASDSWAAFTDGEHGHRVREGGKRRIWQAVEQILTEWQRSSVDDLSGFRYEVVSGHDGYDALGSPAIGVKWQRFRNG
ncbi:methyltransferase domain-containing protein [Glycomyces xiaoerkulensis]|uniref:methyltransferase domain-containing protein n=1 Tax=Glycomyces xiaoerkulensis TaxID=2038139 RepID=UPI0013000889|nr:methyltransferase domain-containing protein [Glycomyces xiaoerkulensis]